MPSNSVISLGLEVDGEKSFNSALNAVDQQIKALGEGVKTASAQMNTMGDSGEAAAKKTELLTKTIEANQAKLNLLGEKYSAAKDRLAELAKAMETAQKSGDPAAIDKAASAYNRQAGEVAKLDAQMSKAQRAIAEATKSMEQGADAAKDEGSEMSKTGKETDSLTDKIDRMSKIMTAEFAAKAAAAVVNGLKTVVNAAVDAGKAFFDITTAAGKYADEIATIAEQSSVDVVDVQKWQYASQFIDTEVSVITGSLTKLTANMNSGSQATSEAFAKLGVSVKDASGQMKDSETILWESIDALGKVENQTERDALAMTLFGKSAQQLNPLINAGSEAFKALGDEAEAAGLILSGDAVNSLGAVDDAMNRVNSGIDGVKNAVAVAFAPAITDMINGANDVVTAMIGMVNGTEGSKEKFIAAIDKMVDTALKLLDEMLPKVLEIGVKVITSLVTGIMNNIQKVTQTITNVVKELLTTIVNHLPEILKAGVDILIAIIDGIIQAIPDLVAATPKIIGAIVSGLAALAPKLLEAGVNIIKGIGQGLADGINWLKDKILGIGGKILDFFANLFGIHSPSTVMRDKIGKNLGLGLAEGILSTTGIVQDAFESLMPNTNALTASVDGYSVAARVADRSGGKAFWTDDRPIILRLNDRELGRAVRGYV